MLGLVVFNGHEYTEIRTFTAIQKLHCWSTRSWRGTCTTSDWHRCAVSLSRPKVFQIPL